MFVDSHCHLHFLDYAKLGLDMDSVVQQAITNQVGTILCVATQMSEIPELYRIAEKYVNVQISIGQHPNDPIDIEPTVNDYLKAAAHPEVVAIGETGLDYYRMPEKNPDLINLQKNRFRAQIRTAKECGKPLIVHTRSAKEDTLQILAAEQAHSVGGVLHCFTEDLDMALRAIDLNFYISFSGIVTFNNAKAVQEVARNIPLDRMLIETDAPFLTPEPNRGTANVPANVRHVAEFIANLRGIPVAELGKQTTKNYLQFISKK